MNKPPGEIDGAQVLYWAWSGANPFGYMGTIVIYGLALCRYSGSKQVYRFSCNSAWETENDAQYDSVEQAISALPDQYRLVEAQWIKVDERL